jgi:hypothetical protein
MCCLACSVQATTHVSSRLGALLFSKHNALQVQISSHVCLSLVSQHDSLPQGREALFYA